MIPFDASRAERLLSAPKLLRENTWSLDRNGAKHRYDLDIPGERLGQLVLAAFVSNGHLDRLSFSLIMTQAGFRQGHRIYGLDLNPNGAHRNPFKPDDPDSGRIFQPGQCHEHCFRDSLAEGRCDAFARPLTQNFNGFEQAIAYVCDKINATQPEYLTQPPRQGTLL